MASAEKRKADDDGSRSDKRPKVSESLFFNNGYNCGLLHARSLILATWRSILSKVTLACSCSKFVYFFRSLWMVHAYAPGDCRKHGPQLREEPRLQGVISKPVM